MSDRNKNNEKSSLESTNSSLNKFELNKKYFTICIYAFFLIITSAFVVFMLLNIEETKNQIYKFLNSISPFLLAVLLAYLVYPFMIRIDRLYAKVIFKKNKLVRVRKGFSILTAYIIVIGVIMVTLIYVIPEVLKSIQDLGGRAGSIYDTIYAYIQNLQGEFPQINFDYVEMKIMELEPNLISYGTNLASSLFPFLINLSFNIAKTFFNIVLSIVISCYMMSDNKNLLVGLKRLIYASMKKRHAEMLCVLGRECNKIFGGYLIGNALDSLIVGILCFIILRIFGLPYSILLSLIVGVTNMIPYFGPFIGAIPGVLIYLFINPKDAIVFVVLIFILQQFDGLYLAPKILGDSTGLKPLWVIFAITIGGAYFGVIGMFLGVPIVAVISYLMNTFIEIKLKKKGIKEV